MNPPRIYAPKAIAPAMQMMTGFMQARMSEGEQFHVGDTLRCSWMWFKIGADEKGETSILAPQMDIMPMRFVADCSEALNLVAAQRYVCDSFGVGCGTCNALQSAIVVKDIANCRQVFMNRTDAEKDKVSGWFFGAADTKLSSEDAGSFELKSLWQLGCEFPQSRDFFLLPQGWQVVFEDRPVVLREFEPASAKAGSYYVTKYQS